MSIAQILSVLAEYQVVFLCLLIFLMIIAIGVMVSVVVRRVRDDYEESHKEENKLLLKNKDFSTLGDDERVDVLRRLIAPDSVDPGPNGYMSINDGGKDAYIRNFTISDMPKRTSFNKTFSELLDFPGCTSSIFVEPISDSEMSRKVDNHLIVLETEHYAAKGDSNRRRKLEIQYNDAERWAEQIESGDEKFFDVGFVFTLYAESLEALNRLSDDFRAVALSKNISITNLYAIQAEAYIANAPFNHMASTDSKYIKSDGIKMFQMDRKSLSTVFNYTESTFTHKDGAPLGRDLFTRKPFVFDLYDPSHDGFIAIIAGKTGSGKSVTIKVLCERYAPLGYRFAAIDSQARKGMTEGEYATLAELLGGVNFQLSNRTNNTLNLFEVHESKTYVKETASSGYEVRTLELSDKIIMVANDIRTLMQEKAAPEPVLDMAIERILKDTVADVYNDFGIYDKDPDSLYEMGESVSDGRLTSGYILKKQPTLTDWFKRLLVKNRDNKDSNLDDAYKYIIMAIKDSIREVYYSKDSVRFFTAEEYMHLEVDSERPGHRIYLNEETDEYEDVEVVKGVRPYFDGQSTLSVTKSCPFTNIDISQLVESERNVARVIAISFLNENFVKANSEDLGEADKLVLINDEAHESFAIPSARKTFANIARTSRKRNVACIFCTQTVAEFDRYDETKDILKQATVKMVCKQDPQDAEYLMKTLHLTQSQVNLLTNYIGYADEADEETKNKHRGEMCVVDTNKVVFVKVDFIRATEGLSAETSSAELRKMIKVG